jgi:uncharacterized membrane protein (DUF485 family)
VPVSRLSSPPAERFGGRMPGETINYTGGAMQQDELQARIRANPKFQQFVSMRNTFGVVMALIGAAAYYGFILLVAFDKGFLATKVAPGAVMSIGIPIGVGVILFTIALTWIYVRRANGEFDETNAAIIKEAQN